MSREPRSNEEMRALSGSTDTNDPVAVLLYLLARDHLPLGSLEELVMAIEGLREEGCGAPHAEFTNGWLGEYAISAADRIRGSAVKTGDKLPDVSAAELERLVVTHLERCGLTSARATSSRWVEYLDYPYFRSPEQVNLLFREVMLSSRNLEVTGVPAENGWMWTATLKKRGASEDV